MFDSYIVKPGDANHYHTHNVTEKRAPTDESVRLLREMEQKAQDEVIQSIRLQNTEFDGVIHVMRNIMDCTTSYRCVFKLNGKKFMAEHVAKEWDDKDSRVIGIRDAVAKEIANTVVSEFLPKIAKELKD